MKFYFLFFVLILISCNSEKKETETKVDDNVEVKDTMQIIKPDVLSVWNELDNIDSPAFYKDDANSFIIATAKESDELVVYDAETAKEIKRVGVSGTGLGQFERPNGIWVYANLCFVVERDNHRVQVLTLPDFKPLTFIGQEKLIKPYGLTVFSKDKRMHLYVTDNYEFVEDSIPADSLLGKRVLHYSFEYAENIKNVKFEKYIGDTQGEGVLKVVESIYADPVNDNLLICEEYEGEGNTCIKLYDLNGKFKKVIGKGLFKSQAEGLALIKCGKDGYWVSTDQSYNSNIFHFFDRKTFDLEASFQSENLSNTDGIWITQKSFGVNSKGAFIAVNNDGGIGYWNLGPLLFKLDLNCNNSNSESGEDEAIEAVGDINRIMIGM